MMIFLTLGFDMTYRQLLACAVLMNEDQLDQDVTVEDPDEYNDGECYAANLRIAGKKHPSLDSGHPIIYVDNNPRLYTGKTNIEIFKDIGLGDLK